MSTSNGALRRLVLINQKSLRMQGQLLDLHSSDISFGFPRPGNNLRFVLVGQRASIEEFFIECVRNDERIFEMRELPVMNDAVLEAPLACEFPQVPVWFGSCQKGPGN
jgi:hypothetical protein